MIDYTYSDLSDDEIALYKERDRQEAESEREKARKRREKMNSFRWQGGMC